jgi:hypothetical protein
VSIVSEPDRFSTGVGHRRALSATTREGQDCVIRPALAIDSGLNGTDDSVLNGEKHLKISTSACIRLKRPQEPV